MTSISRLLWLRIIGTSFLCWSTSGAWALAQGAPAEEAKKPAAAPVAKPRADTEEAKKTGDTPAEKTPAPPPETDPLILAILEVKPTTPEQRVLDIRTLLNLNRFDLAKTYVEELAAAMPPADELTRLQARFGSALFMQLSSQPELQPAGQQVGDAVLQAADTRVRDAARLTTLISELANTDTGARRSAANELVQAGPVAIPILLQALGTPAAAAVHPLLAQILVAIGETCVEPLTLALDSGNASVQTAAANVLGEIASRRAAPYLVAAALSEAVDPAAREAAGKAAEKILGALPAREAAEEMLQRQLRMFEATARPANDGEATDASIWTWDAAQQLPVERILPAADAAFLQAARVAHLLHQLDPQQPAHRTLDLVMALEAAKREQGYDRPIVAATVPALTTAAQAGSKELEEALILALRKKLYGAAAALIDALAESGDGSLVKSSGGQPRLLVQALLSPHRRVQFAAARAILKLAPTETYAGSSHLPEVLGYLMASAGRQRVLIGERRTEVARTMAGYFDELGFDADTETGGRALALRAFDNPDYVFALVGAALDRPAYRELVQILRNDPRTADLPIGILSGEANVSAAAGWDPADQLTVAFPPPQNRDDVVADTQRLLKLAGRRLLSADERLREAQFALDAVANMAAEPAKFGYYDLRRLERRVQQALDVPSLVAPALRLLGLFGTPNAQQLLIEYANSQDRPLVNRQAAVEALRGAVDRQGLLLTQVQLQKQYNLYNASEALDRPTQEVLAAILDVIETPARKAAETKKDQ
jgi:hypothetical protein